MPTNVTETSNFPAGTSEDAVKAVQKARLDSGAKSCTYTGSETEGWTMTTVWSVPD